jgi:putative pyruvate formate lyase activating enzyme
MGLPMGASYLSLLENGELARRAELAQHWLENCTGCPFRCKINRQAGKMGVCRTGAQAKVSGYWAHPGEESVLSGTRGSGTVFFARCNLHCVFCQNHDISQIENGREVSALELAAIFLELQAMGCHNINLVSPSHVVPQILAALLIAAQNGLTLPLVYNTGGYDALETLALLEGVVDIYLPDMKYADPRLAHQYSGPRDYPRVNQVAIREMYRQVGDLVVDADGIAVRGMLVRHLVLPNRQAGTKDVAAFLSKEISTTTAIHIMDQYMPVYRAASFPVINRAITPQEYREALDTARLAGLQRILER